MNNENIFTKRMLELGNNELLKIIDRKDEYQPLAVAAAAKEILKRNLIKDEKTIKTLQQIIKKEDDLYKKRQVTELPRIPKIYSKKNIALSWSVMWRSFFLIFIALAIEYTLTILFKFSLSVFLALIQQYEPDYFMAIFFIVFFVIFRIVIFNWFGKIAIKKHYNITTKKFIGWSVWWRTTIIFLPLVGLIGFLLEPMNKSDNLIIYILFMLYIYFLYILLIPGWALHQLFKKIPKENWNNIIP